MIAPRKNHEELNRRGSGNLLVPRGGKQRGRGFARTSPAPSPAVYRGNLTVMERSGFASLIVVIKKTVSKTWGWASVKNRGFLKGSFPRGGTK